MGTSAPTAGKKPASAAPAASVAEVGMTRANDWSVISIADRGGSICASACVGFIAPGAVP